MVFPRTLKEKFTNVLKRKKVRTVKPYSFYRIIITMKKNKDDLHCLYLPSFGQILTILNHFFSFFPFFETFISLGMCYCCIFPIILSFSIQLFYTSTLFSLEFEYKIQDHFYRKESVEDICMCKTNNTILFCCSAYMCDVSLCVAFQIFSPFCCNNF